MNRIVIDFSHMIVRKAIKTYGYRDMDRMMRKAISHILDNGVDNKGAQILQ